MSDYSKYMSDGKTKIKLSKLDTDGGISKDKKEKILAKTQENQEKICELQDKLYADSKEGLVIVLQAMDAAGKDSTVKHVMSGVNPQGVDVYSFKQPSTEELKHDFLWRIHRCIPERGKIGLFNRSYYEDVLVAKVHELNKTYKMPLRCTDISTDKFFAMRYEDIANYEKYLYHNGYRIIKVFLHVSKSMQKKRFLERIEKPEKNWKFSAADLKERALWDNYQKAYEDAIEATSSKEAPWYILPADKKWYTRFLVSEILLDTLTKMDPQYPEISKEETEALEDYKATLEAEK